jgi:hypothetical protein
VLPGFRFALFLPFADTQTRFGAAKGGITLILKRARFHRVQLAIRCVRAIRRNRRQIVGFSPVDRRGRLRVKSACARRRTVTTCLGGWILLMVLVIYVPVMIVALSQPGTPVKLEGINYFADTLLFAGGSLALAGSTPRSVSGPDGSSRRPRTRYDPVS